MEMYAKTGATAGEKKNILRSMPRKKGTGQHEVNFEEKKALCRKAFVGWVGQS